MKTELLDGIEPLPNDDAITRQVLAGADDPYWFGSTPWSYGVRNAEGRIYRRITIESVSELDRTFGVFQDLGFVDELAESGKQREGCDGIFRRA